MKASKTSTNWQKHKTIDKGNKYSHNTINFKLKPIVHKSEKLKKNLRKLNPFNVVTLLIEKQKNLNRKKTKIELKVKWEKNK